MNAIAKRLMQLEKEIKEFKLEDLAKSELFVTAVLHASTVALRTHQEEKLRALQNAIINVARGIDIEENLQLLFLNAVDDLTTLHLKILKYFDDPRKWLEGHGKSFRTVIYLHETGRSKTPLHVSWGLENAFGELQHAIYDPIVTDLYNRGLINIDKTSLHAEIDPTDLLSSRTTRLGRQFLKYIGEWRPGIQGST